MKKIRMLLLEPTSSFVSMIVYLEITGTSTSETANADMTYVSRAGFMLGDLGVSRRFARLTHLLGVFRKHCTITWDMPMIYIYTYMCVRYTYNFFKPLEIDEVFLGVFTSKHGSSKAQIFRSGEEEKDVVF